MRCRTTRESRVDRILNSIKADRLLADVTQEMCVISPTHRLILGVSLTAWSLNASSC
jgi:hypothetical protein